MDKALVPAKGKKGEVLFVLKSSLDHLIKEEKIQSIRRSGGWIEPQGLLHQRDDGPKDYNGAERRFCRAVNWPLFSLSIEEQLRRGHSVEAVLGYGERAREIALKLKNVAKTHLSVLIQGKTGTGKGVAALILHELSKRKDKPFIKVDCGALPPTLIESELFGYEKGSFTGAFKSKPGRFQMANGGTVFLDEIGNLSMDMQTRLLGFLEERVVNSIGGVRSVKLDVRIISATNVDLAEQVQRYQFREDLFYRLNEFEIHMPSLRAQTDDILYLAAKFLIMANAELEKNISGFSEGAIDFLCEYDCTGNIRELKNLIKRAALVADEVIEAEHLLNQAHEGEARESLDGCLENALVKGCSLHTINEMIRIVAEKRIIGRVYERSCGNKKRTCEALGIDYSTLFRKMRAYSMS